jgi:prepilin-type N-terminal cleavage/methylation domain-containing protein
MERATVTTGNRLARLAARRSRCKHARAEGGFTLIELLIVVTLIVVLAGIGLSTYSTSVARAKEAVLRENLFRMRDSIDQFYADKGTYPPDISSLVTDGYLRTIPKDPFTESSETWQIVMSEPDPANPNAAPGVYDVKSGAEGVSLDGTPYADFQ